jgi:CubicO group peptidase (beta-lactamase class C family)
MDKRLLSFKPNWRRPHRTALDFDDDRFCMKQSRWLRWSFLALLMLGAQAKAADAGSLPDAVVQARIARVEQGLTTRIVVKGAAGRKMSLVERMAYHQVPAVSIALINDGRVEWTRAHGVADAGGTQPVDPGTLFQAGSISKAITAIGALQLVEQGQLSLDKKANLQLVSWKIPDNDFTRRRPVTLRMLLNHSAGTTVHGYDGYARGEPLPTLLQDLDGIAPANAAPIRVDVLPGSLWRYSGGGYSVIQQLMEDAGEQPFAALIGHGVLEPLGMADSTFAVPLPAAREGHAASGHDGQGHAIQGRWRNYPEAAPAGLWSTPRDLARVVLAVQQASAGRTGGILSPESVRMMLTRGLGEYGLGFFVEDLGDRTSFSHSGGVAGFRAQLYGYTGTGQGVVVMTNSDSGAALIDEILCSIAAEYGWPEFKVVEKRPAAVDGAANRQAAGDYLLLDRPARIVAEGERLFFQSPLFGAHRMELFPEAPGSYFMTAQDMTLRLERDADGQVSGLTLLRGAGRYSAKRMR